MSNRRLAHDWFARSMPANISIGEGSWLHSAYAFLHYRSTRPCGLRVGHDTGIYDGSMFDLGPRGEVRIGNYCTLAGPIFATNGPVLIGDYVFISSEVVIGESDVVTPSAEHDPRAPAARWRTSSQAITIGDTAWVGARAVVLGGARIGYGAIVGAGAVVQGDVPAYAIAAGNPARVVGWARPYEQHA